MLTRQQQPTKFRGGAGNTTVRIAPTTDVCIDTRRAEAETALRRAYRDFERLPSADTHDALLIAMARYEKLRFSLETEGKLW